MSATWLLTTDYNTTMPKLTSSFFGGELYHCPNASQNQVMLIIEGYHIGLHVFRKYKVDNVAYVSIFITFILMRL